ncbi:MAG: hypothetical protein CVU86_05435 [Firmicutes bacterium HGW-Firmicutes-11]|nr:MAG: hypothetical protein CVU86_05435 [Firmicutes bacterium HGW-Firmicutes-11]
MCIDAKARSGKNGFLILEAAILLPVVLLTLISLILVIRSIGVEEKMMGWFSEEAQKVSIGAYILRPEEEDNDSTGMLPYELLQYGIWESAVQNKALRKDLPIAAATLEEFQYLYNAHNITDLIQGSLHYQIKLPLPAGFHRETRYVETLLFRGFVGATGNSDPLGFAQMEQNSLNDLVYIFPRAGERYHDRNCRVIIVYPEQVLLTTVLKKRIDPCRLCRPDAEKIGSLVYLFPETGSVFHTGTCSLVDRYVVAVLKSTAVEAGYTPCFYCLTGSE